MRIKHSKSDTGEYKYMKEKLSSKSIQLAVFLIVMFIACAPLMTENCINGHDVDYHLLRIESLKEGILMGKPFLKVNVLFLGGAGYASSMFYPDLFLYFPAILRVMGVGINASYHAFVFLCFVLCYLSMYYCVKQISKNRMAATIASVAVTLCQYHLDDVYTRSAVGEYTALIFIPFVMLGIYDILYEQMHRPWSFALGFAGVLLCHTNSLIMCVGICLVAFLIKFKVFIKNGKLFLKVILTTIFTIAVTSFYWLPMIEQMMSQRFMVNQAWIMPDDAMMEVSTVFSYVFPTVGVALLVLNLPRILLKKTSENKELIQFTDLTLLAGILFSLVATRLFPWERLGAYLSFIQFPWRLYIMASACLAISAGIIISMIWTDQKSQELALLVVLVIMCLTATKTISMNEEGYYSYSNDYYAYKPYTFHIIAGEWLPEKVTDIKALENKTDIAVSDTGEELAVEHIKNTIKIETDQKQFAYLDVPFIYYKGYQAYYVDQNQNKKELKLSGEGNNGLCRIVCNDEVM
ncbi:MAG: hypothetical protein GX567_16565, partial [Clostridia bacterium]|nr:hypothetical protein [Clostridia bacterium]